MTMQEGEAIDKNSVIPIYYQLAKLIREQIRRGEFKPGEALPTEIEIANRYEISRMTVRRSIAELVSEGMVYALQGKGTFVASPKLDNVVFELNNFNREMAQRGLNFKTTLLQAKILRADDELKERFRLGEGTHRILHFRTVTAAEDERLSLENKYIIYTKSKPLLESELNDPTLPGLIASHSDYLPVSAKKVLKAVVATNEEAALLGIAAGSPLFLVETTVFDPDLKPVGWSKSIYRGDRYKITSYDGWYQKE
ncbi:GntR bacterial regulatory protein HTH signature [Acididesulfobacillus acetoxydans]|uniref:GntR bacterial regulatory protein HTH signature n=2 Tax=Acididesulfobacillus acetoxydans TaxID=1561005 RepID=A0A8S0WMT6_9FIRM|nr:GntR bacterial regulatory protein HTH signature [Acididesulfobacillus acetoxydans]CEJ08622.1 HTH-type transcriptional repressor YvoA [Acididesulfobacillus acetoxydans]